MYTLRISTLILLFLLQSAVSQATTYYVTTTGSDENDGASVDTAWATLQYAATKVGPGDTVIIAPGEYTGFRHSMAEGHASGTEDARITYLADGPGVKITTGVPNVIPEGTPGGGGIYGIQIIDADYITLDGFEVSGMSRAGIGIEECRYVTVRNCVSTRNGRWGIFTSFADYCTIEYNRCSFSEREHGIYYSNTSKGALIRYNVSHSNVSAGIHMNGDRFFFPKVREGIDVTGIIEGAEIYGNIIYNVGTRGAAAINMDGVQNALIYNNLIYDAYAGGITCFGIDGAIPSQNATIINNTIIMASTGRSGIQLADHTDFETGATGGTIYNNIIIHPGNRAVIEAHQRSLEGLSTGHNIVSDRFQIAGANVTLAAWQQQGYGQNSRLAGSLPDLFEDPAGKNYRTKASSSAIDAGADWVAALPDDDLEGNARPSGLTYDIGAYEIQQTASGQWGGYDIFQDQILAPDWIGHAYVGDAPWVYAYGLASWLYIEEPASEDPGAWCFIVH